MCSPASSWGFSSLVFIYFDKFRRMEADIPQRAGERQHPHAFQRAVKRRVVAHITVPQQLAYCNEPVGAHNFDLKCRRIFIVSKRVADKKA